MQAKDGDAIDAVDAIDWESWRPTRPSASLRRSRLPSVLLAIVVLGHGLVVWRAWLDNAKRLPAVEVEEALLINFIERPTPRPSVRRVTHRPARAASNSFQAAQPQQLDRVSDVPTGKPESSSSPLRLRLEAESWSVTQSPAARNLSANPRSSQQNSVLEHGKPHLRGVQLRERKSAQQALAMLGALFGSPPYDPCPQVSGRLANLHSERHELDLAADLLVRERRCQR